jgi:hypothetical protein
VEFEIGIGGLSLLIAMSLGFGVVAHVVRKPGTRWMWLVAATAWFVGGLFASEVIWGQMTVDEIQPIIDGLAFDESLLGGLVLGVATVLATWFVTGSSRFHRPVSP